MTMLSPSDLPHSSVWSNSGRRAATLHLIRLGFGAIVVFFVLVVGLTTTQLVSSQRTLATAIAYNNEHSKHSREMIAAARERSFLLFSIANQGTDPFKRDEEIIKFHELATVYAQARRELFALGLSEEERALLEQQRLLVAELTILKQQVIDLALQDDYDQAERLMLDKSLPLQDKLVEILNAYIEFQGNEISAASDEAHLQEKHAIYILIISSFLFVILSTVISRFVYRRTQQMVDALANTSNHLQSSNQELEFQKFALDQHAIVSIADVSGKITYVNGLFCQISQYSPDELLGQDHRLLNSGYHPKEFFNDMWHTIASGKVWHGEIRNRKKNGDFYWVETTIVPFLDSTGKPERYVSMRTEITAVKEAELMLKQGKDRLEQMVEERTRDLEESRHIMQSITGAAQDAIAMIDDAGNTTYWNEAAERLLGFSRDQVMGKNLHAFIAPERYHATHQRAFTHFIHSGDGDLVGKTTEVLAKRPDGSEVPVELSLSGVKIRGRWHGIGIMRDISERKRMEKLLREQATTDPLTGIHNRRKFDEFMALEQHRCTRYQVPFTLILLDIDHFKRINDTYGHPVGDAVLKELVTIVTANIRNSDLFARWGGEEFAILASNCDLSHSRLLAEKLRHVIASYTFPAINKLTCSFGVAEYQPGESGEAFIAKADGALYKAKQLGRNRVEYA